MITKTCRVVWAFSIYVLVMIFLAGCSSEVSEEVIDRAVLLEFSPGPAEESLFRGGFGKFKAKRELVGSGGIQIREGRLLCLILTKVNGEVVLPPTLLDEFDSWVDEFGVENVRLWAGGKELGGENPFFGIPPGGGSAENVFAGWRDLLSANGEQWESQWDLALRGEF